MLYISPVDPCLLGSCEASFSWNGGIHLFFRSFADLCGAEDLSNLNELGLLLGKEFISFRILE